MAHIIVFGGGIGGVSSAYELKQAIRREDRVTLVSTNHSSNSRLPTPG